ncbi:hypothetical protein DL96DRAFT_1613569 [Flagelloscypha sp. PMI_526]|nr:hypothetical protein DL96DRAFT_1613569 [Flagelloscypha sp. PMI_526]
MNRPPGTPLLPFEILDKILVLAVDSGGRNVAFNLNLVSSTFHETTMKRLYHTLHLDSEGKLELLFRQSILSRGWIAASVRVLVVGGNHCKHSDNLLQQVLPTLTGLISISLSWSATISPTCRLPRLHRIVYTGFSPLPPYISHIITHLHIPLYAFSQVLQMKKEFKHLTHLLVMSSERGITTLPRFMADLRKGIPRSLRYLVIFTGALPIYLSKDEDLNAFQEILDSDNRIILWNTKNVSMPLKIPRLLIFDDIHTISHYLDALNEGDIGFWELVEQV